MSGLYLIGKLLPVPPHEQGGMACGFVTCARLACTCNALWAQWPGREFAELGHKFIVHACCDWTGRLWSSRIYMVACSIKSYWGSCCIHVFAVNAASACMHVRHNWQLSTLLHQNVSLKFAVEIWIATIARECASLQLKVQLKASLEKLHHFVNQ